MKRLFLASSIDRTGPAIGREICVVLKKKAGEIKVAFINTASEGSTSPDKTWLDHDRQGMSSIGFEIFDYTITGKKHEDFSKDLGSCDVIHVNGGNSFYLLLQAKKSGFDRWIKEKVEKDGVIYTGSSAGSQFVSPDIEILALPDSKQYLEELKDTKAVGLVDFVVFPHWGSEKFKERYFGHRLNLAYRPENKIIILNDSQFIRVENDNYRIVDIRD